MNVLKSRTVWAVVLLAAYNGLESVHSLLPASFAPYVDAVLGVAAIWFRTHPVQEF